MHGIRHELGVFFTIELVSFVATGAEATQRSSFLFRDEVTQCFSFPLVGRKSVAYLLNSVKVQWTNAHRKKSDSKGLMNSTNFLYFMKLCDHVILPLGAFRSWISAFFFFGKLKNDFRCRTKINWTWKWKRTCVYKVMMNALNNWYYSRETNVRALLLGNAATDTRKTNVNTKIKTSRW